MKTGIVKALALSGKANKVFRSGDAVKESNFPEGNWSKLVQEGFITEDVVVTESNDDTSTTLSVTDADNSVVIPAFDDISKKEIIAKLKEKGVEVDEKLTKQKLYDLL